MYYLQLGNTIYEKKDGELFSLAECWRELEGVGQARILSATGRVVLENAGAQVARRYEVRKMYRGN